MYAPVPCTSWLEVKNDELGDVDRVIEQARASGFSRSFQGEDRFFIEFIDQQPFLAGCYTEAQLRSECARLEEERLRIAS